MTQLAVRARGRRLGVTWPSYGVTFGFGATIYLLGSITPYVASDLRLGSAEVGMVAAALSVGFVVAGLASDRVQARIGRLATVLWLALLAASSVAFVLASSLPVLLIATMALGIATGAIFSPVNGMLVATGGARSPTLLARSTVWGMVGGLAAPTLVATVAPTPLTWRAGFLLPTFVLGGARVLLSLAGNLPAPIHPGRTPRIAGSAPNLPGRYWVAWLFLASSIALEFGCAFWGASLVRTTTNASLQEATGLIASFVGAMLVGRLALGTANVAGKRTIPLARAAIGLVAIGVVLMWLGRDLVAAGIGLFIAGLGVSILYPLGVVLAISAAPGRSEAASARLLFASGLALLATPPALGILAGAVGIHAAWVLMFVLCAATLALTFVVRPPGEA
jgi:MFS family permease